MGSRNYNVTRFEVSGVYTHPDAYADIVLVHGLNGEPKKTWTAKNDVFWPADLLPDSLKDHPANILVYGYNADVYSRGHDGSASDNFIHQHAQTLVTHLTSYRKREGTSNIPIIWVAHSLGGILVKRALLYSNDVQDINHEPYRAIYVSTFSIVFLGTPHNGSDLADWGFILQAMSDAIVPKKFFESESILLKSLKRNSEVLQDINIRFLDIYRRFEIHMAREGHTTDLKGTKAYVVTSDSAGPPLPGIVYYTIEATHSGICKFGDANAPGYRTVADAIYEWVAKAVSVIELRWRIEEHDRMIYARYVSKMDRKFTDNSQPGNASHYGKTNVQSEKSLLQSPDEYINSHPATSAANYRAQGSAGSLARPAVVLPQQSPSENTSEHLFVHPEQFRPNSYFVGREKELEELHAKLMDRKKLAEGTSAVLIHSLPGGGKTHLARQYVFSHRADYPGGVYWVRAKSITEMEQIYWDIANNPVFREQMQRLSSSPVAAQSTDHILHKHRDIVTVVREWFSGFDRWLLIFDGIHFDTPGITRFIPDAKNTSLIYTSIQQSAIGMYEFNNPQLVELDLLSPQDAQLLLLREMQKKKPWTQDDRARALELVQMMGCLPLMIHVAARHLKATREPLYKYLRTYQARPRASQLSAYRAVYSELEKRGASAALNLMAITAFYDQRIPVGMLSLGCSALDKATPVTTYNARHRSKSLNNSLTILIEFALVERTETDGLSPRSSRGSIKHNSDRGIDSVDILRIHSVVQAFFIDLLAEKKQLQYWLERASRVFVESFNEASKRINEEPKVGRPDDYLRFIVHGRKLLEHLTRATEKKVNTQLGDLAKQLGAIEKILELSQQAMDRLLEELQSPVTQGSVLSDGVSHEDISLLSVFERGNSLSESDSASQSSVQSLAVAPASSSVSGAGFAVSNTGEITTQSSVAGLGKLKSLRGESWISQTYDGSMQLHDSPTQYNDSQGADIPNPYHWHVPIPPYPSQGNTIPVPSLHDDVDDTTLIGTPHAGQGPSSSPASSSWAMWSSPQPVPRSLQTAVHSHRTIKRNEGRRYHYRAGSWRDNSVSDARISMSREIARGSVLTRTDINEAKVALNKIKASILPIASSSPTVPTLETPQTRGASCGNRPTRNQPQSMKGKKSGVYNNITGVESDRILDRKSSSSPSSILHDSPSNSWPKTTLKRPKDNILPSRPELISKHEVADNGHVRIVSAPDYHDSLSESVVSLINKQSSPMFMGSRSVQSSPSQTQHPFRSPYPRPDLLASQDDFGKRRPRSGSDVLPPSMRPWVTQTYIKGSLYAVPTEPSFGPLADELMTASYPPPLPRGSFMNDSSPHHPLRQSRLHPLSKVSGYTSQPMSRKTSSQSQSEAIPEAGIAFSASSSSLPEQSKFYSHSLPSSSSGHAGLPLTMTSRRPQSPISWIQTEPSPRTSDAFPGEVNKSCQQWSGSSEGVSTGVPRTPRTVSTAEPIEQSGSGGIVLPSGLTVPFGHVPEWLSRAEGSVMDSGDASNSTVGLGIAQRR